VGVVALLAACSASDEGQRSEQERLLQSVFEQGGEEANSLVFDHDAAACAAEHVVESLGADRLRALGLDVPSRRGPDLTEPPLSEAEGDAVYAAFTDCLDLVDQLTTAFGRDADLPDGQAECVAGRYVDSDVLRQSLLAPSFDPALEDRIDSTVQTAISACTADA
jgi:hypothetical protein